MKEYTYADEYLYGADDDDDFGDKKDWYYYFKCQIKNKKSLHLWVLARLFTYDSDFWDISSSDFTSEILLSEALTTIFSFIDEDTNKLLNSSLLIESRIELRLF